jgi:hypothetical protein
MLVNLVLTGEQQHEIKNFDPEYKFTFCNQFRPSGRCRISGLAQGNGQKTGRRKGT